MSVGPSSPTLETMPPEILERIAIFVGTSKLKGPPSDLAALCRTSHLIHASLALQHAPTIYAAIFRAKFDIMAPMRRLGRERVMASNLASELRSRFTSLQRFRTGGAVGPGDLWVAVFMALENAGKNMVQLSDHAAVDAWLRSFLLDAIGGSDIVRDMENGLWPRDTELNSLALWLLWLCDSDGIRNESVAVRRKYCEVLRTYALGAPKYAVTHQSWVAFSRVPGIPPWQRVACTYFGVSLRPIAPAISIPAILGYIARIKEPRQVMHASAGTTAVDSSLRWDSDWARCVDAPSVHRLGELDGAWEGPFTYTEFSVYATILSGGPPQMLHDGATGQNLQVWRLREYCLYTTDVGEGLPPGDVLDAFFPVSTTATEMEDQLVLTHASKDFTYTRVAKTTLGGHEDPSRTLFDVVIFGEGHSSWGSFRLRGRVRSSDAFVTILKEYDDSDDRGRWLYRGYLVGGKLTGRWRDSFSPSMMNGYEGCFALDQRV